MQDKKNPVRSKIFFSLFIVLSLSAVVLWQSFFAGRPDEYEKTWLFFGFLLSVLSLFVILLMRSLESDKKAYLSSSRDHRLKLGLLECELKDKESRAGIFLEACAELFNASDFSELFENVIEAACAALNADQGSVMLIDEDQKLKIVSSRGLADEVVANVHLSLGERVAGLAASEKKEFLLNGDLDQYPLFNALEPNPLIRSSIVCPIYYKNEVFGVLNLSRTGHGEKYSSADLKRATVFAKQVAVAMNYHRMCKALHDNAVQLKKAYHYLKESQQELRDLEKAAPLLGPSAPYRVKAS